MSSGRSERGTTGLAVVMCLYYCFYLVGYVEIGYPDIKT